MERRERSDMVRKMSEAEAWLSREDTVCRDGRISRLEWLASVLPPGESKLFPGGPMAKCLFEEMRYCFAYAQFLATIMVGFAFIERTLAAEFFAAGRNDLERVGIQTLLKEAGKRGILSNDEARELDHIRRARNPVTHFRQPGADDSIEARSVHTRERPYDLMEQDARAVVVAAMKTLSKDVI
jgi:hypothetical protein